MKALLFLLFVENWVKCSDYLVPIVPTVCQIPHPLKNQGKERWCPSIQYIQVQSSGAMGSHSLITILWNMELFQVSFISHIFTLRSR